MSLVAFLRFQLDVTCSGAQAGSDERGFTNNVQHLSQCQCGAKPCPPGVLCRENALPELCPAGHYCPDYAGVSYVCPQGHFCPVGAREATPCNAGAVCWEGYERPYEFVPFFFLILALVGLFGARAALERRRRHKLTGRIQTDITKKADIQEMTTTAETASGRDARHLSPALRPGTTVDIKFNTLGLRVRKPSGACCGLIAPTGHFPNVDEDGMITRLASVTGSLPPGTVTGVMGPSGSGKTTFLNVLCGKIKHSHGSIKINGKPGTLTDYRYKKHFLDNVCSTSSLHARNINNFSLTRTAQACGWICSSR